MKEGGGGLSERDRAGGSGSLRKSDTQKEAHSTVRSVGALFLKSEFSVQIPRESTKSGSMSHSELK